MFEKIGQTAYPPKDKALMVYDGNCGFCKYWVIKWMKITKLMVNYKPYQEVHDDFKDIPLKHFQSAVRYIDTTGEVSSGPDAAYITYFIQGRLTYLHQWYTKGGLFMKLSDIIYQWIANHRGFMSKISFILFGRNPQQPKAYWKWYLFLLLGLLLSLTYLLLTNI